LSQATRKFILNGETLLFVGKKIHTFAPMTGEGKSERSEGITEPKLMISTRVGHFGISDLSIPNRKNLNRKCQFVSNI